VIRHKGRAFVVQPCQVNDATPLRGRAKQHEARPVEQKAKEPVEGGTPELSFGVHAPGP
jgi:hypothetical protein